MYRLEGEWVGKKSWYEAGICQTLGIELQKGRYWDGKWGEYLLEFKKGKSIWLDLVRYSEFLLHHRVLDVLHEDAGKEVLSLFFLPDASRHRIIEIIGVESCALVKQLNLSERYAAVLLALSLNVPHSLNAQASLTLKDLRNIQAFSVF
ncbi:hypothetical protein MYX78_13415 [Acidobacteria bacterium AH-259-G07]|nr:hypothetical protein [Acidobacteria bacterium AH-259-G07]